MKDLLKLIEMKRNGLKRNGDEWKTCLEMKYKGLDGIRIIVSAKWNEMEWNGN